MKNKSSMVMKFLTCPFFCILLLSSCLNDKKEAAVDNGDIKTADSGLTITIDADGNQYIKARDGRPGKSGGKGRFFGIFGEDGEDGEDGEAIVINYNSDSGNGSGSGNGNGSGSK